MWAFETDRKSQCLEGVDFYHDLHPSMPMLPRIYPHRFGLATVQLLPKLRTEGEGAPELASKPDGPAIFNSMSWNTDVNWDEVRFKPMLVYLRGNKSLALPEEWKRVFPMKI